MERVMRFVKSKPNPQQILRDWQRRLRQECRSIDRQIRDIQREEKNVQKAIKDAARRNDMVSAKSLAKEIVRSRLTVNRLYENKAQLNSISMHLGESVAISRTVNHLSKSSEVMKLVNNLMKAPELAVTMQEFNKEMTKAGVIEEMVNDAVDTAIDSEDIEEEIEEEVDKVLTSIAGETASQLPETKQRLKQPIHKEESPIEVCPPTSFLRFSSNTLIHDTLIHDTLIHDTLIHDTLIHDTLIHDTLIFVFVKGKRGRRTGRNTREISQSTLMMMTIVVIFIYGVYFYPIY